MVPAPITAARSSGRTGVSGPMPSTLAAARSAKKAYRRPLDSGVSISSRNARRSRARPSSNGPPAAAIASTARMGAGSRGRALPSLARAAAHRAARLGSSSGRSRALGGGLVAVATEAATSMAAGSGSPSTTRSSSRVSARATAGTGSPVVIISIARSTPTRRGRRWVPPAPGMRPSLTSGRPSFASALATR